MEEAIIGGIVRGAFTAVALCLIDYALGVFTAREIFLGAWCATFTAAQVSWQYQKESKS